METGSLDQPESAETEYQEVSSQERIGRAMADLKARGDKGASWFLYIAILSLVNTAVIHLGANHQFAIGLGITLIADVVAKVFGNQNPQFATIAMALSICFSIFIAGISILVGRLARKRNIRVFGLGMFLYLLDGLLFVLVEDYFSAAFHAYIIFGMFRGIRAYQQLRRLEIALEQATMDNQTDSGSRLTY